MKGNEVSACWILQASCIAGSCVACVCTLRAAQLLKAVPHFSVRDVAMVMIDPVGSY